MRLNVHLDGVCPNTILRIQSDEIIPTMLTRVPAFTAAIDIHATQQLPRNGHCDRHRPRVSL